MEPPICINTQSLSSELLELSVLLDRLQQGKEAYMAPCQHNNTSNTTNLETHLGCPW
jgi:hypothetical protein